MQKARNRTEMNGYGADTNVSGLLDHHLEPGSEGGGVLAWWSGGRLGVGSTALGAGASVPARGAGMPGRWPGPARQCARPGRGRSCSRGERLAQQLPSWRSGLLKVGLRWTAARCLPFGRFAPRWSGRGGWSSDGALRNATSADDDP